MTEATIPKKHVEELTTALAGGDTAASVAATEAALSAGVDPLALIQQVVVPTLTDVGQKFEDLDIFLPELMAAGEAGNACSKVIEDALTKSGAESYTKGSIVLGAVKGDIHDIGKNIVCTLLENHGFEVIDLGKNVPASKILEVALAKDVDAVGLSALMTTTLQQMEVTLGKLRDAGIKVFTMVGGAVVSQDYADSIGADIYAKDALEAVAKVKAALGH